MWHFGVQPNTRQKSAPAPTLAPGLTSGLTALQSPAAFLLANLRQLDQAGR